MSPVIHVVLTEPAWPDLADREKDVIKLTGPFGMTALAGGMESGATAVAFRFDLPDGRVLIAETSLAALTACVRALTARYPSPAGVGENAP